MQAIFVPALPQRGVGVCKTRKRPGTQRDAVLFGIGANSVHGLPRTKAGKRAVALVLADPEWSQWSDREIGRRCQLSIVSSAGCGAAHLVLNTR
jgi:hypothetical protein